MATIQRDQRKVPALRQEETDSSAIGGTVIVRGALMGDRMALLDETKALPESRQNYQVVIETLARSVFLDDGLPVYSLDEWDRFASANYDEALRLFGITSRLNGGDAEAVAKN